MNPEDRSIRDLLRDGDPVAHEPAPRREGVARIRQRVLAEIERPRVTRWTPMLAAAGVLTLTLILGWGLTRGIPLPAGVDGAIPAAGDEARPVRLEFSTPGGTRVVWILDPEFEICQDG